MDEFVFRHSGGDFIEEVRMLWNKLKDHHAQLSARFGSKIALRAFDDRKHKLLAKCGELRVELVSTAVSNVVVAYCIGSVSTDGVGEVDSLFVEEELRGKGIGTELMRRALAWFDSATTTSRIVSVLKENDQAFAFYRRFGFHPQTVIMQQIES